MIALNKIDDLFNNDLDHWPDIAGDCLNIPEVMEAQPAQDLDPDLHGYLSDCCVVNDQALTTHLFLTVQTDQDCQYFSFIA